MPFGLRRKKKEKTAFTFPGQGIHKLGMAKDLSPATVERLRSLTAEVLREEIVSRIFSLISPAALEAVPELQQKMRAELHNTQNTQLAVFLVSYGKYLEISESEDFVMPDFMLGHSLGEWTALCASGSLDFKSALKAVHYRGGLMDSAVMYEKGGMAAVRNHDIKIKTVEKCLEVEGTDVQIANYNTPRQIVISGEELGIDLVTPKLTAKGYKVSKLRVAGAFHHPSFMASVEHGLSHALDDFGIDIHKPAVPIIFNFTGSPEQDPKRIKTFLIKQPSNTVRWMESIEFLIKEGVPKENIREVGPASVLTGMLDDFPGFEKNKKT